MLIYLLVFQFLVKHTVLSNIFKILNQKIREPKLRNVAKMSNSNSEILLGTVEYICNNFQLVKLDRSDPPPPLAEIPAKNAFFFTCSLGVGPREEEDSL